MQLIRDNPGSQVLRSSVVTIGNFDGLHLGHQALIERCKILAKTSPANTHSANTISSGERRPVVVVTFEPLPIAWFRPDAAPARLMSARQKLEALHRQSVDLVWMMRFNRSLAEMSADDFVQSVLLDVLGATDVVVGADFHYGKSRQGNTESLRMAGEQLGFGLHTVETIEVDGKRASSSEVRRCLAMGELQQAEKLLGGAFRTQGRVIRGRQLGRKLGFPTANMPLAVSPSPLEGIFAVRVRSLCGVDKGWRNGVANLGTRPAVGGEGFLVEVHLIDFDADLYGQRLEVEYIKKLRDEEHFEDIDDLVMQMREDERLARGAFLDWQQNKDKYGL
jgi:riboflavin kinase/FMN adenylyltransferase